MDTLFSFLLTPVIIFWLNKKVQGNSSTILSILQDFNENDKNFIRNVERLLEKHVGTPSKLFKLLDYQESYKKINKKGFRIAMTSVITDFFHLISLRKQIESADWDENKKTEFILEIDILEKILDRR